MGVEQVSGIVDENETEVRTITFKLSLQRVRSASNPLSGLSPRHLLEVTGERMGLFQVRQTSILNYNQGVFWVSARSAGCVYWNTIHTVTAHSVLYFFIILK